MGSHSMFLDRKTKYEEVVSFLIDQQIQCNTNKLSQQ